MNKFIHTLFFLCLILGTACKKEGNTIPEDKDLYRHIGYNKQYTTLTVQPLYDTEQASPAFQELFWLIRENMRINYGGRQAERFEIVFTSDTAITVRVYYRADTGMATATYTYNYVWDADGLLVLSELAASNTNGNNVLPYITELLEDYLAAHSFRAGWIEHKLPGTKGTVAAFYRSDDPADFFYGNLN